MTEVLTSKRVDELVTACMFTENEIKTLPRETPAVAAPGIIHTLVFVPDRVEQHQEEIRDMLYELDDNYRMPDEDHPNYGGGWSFLNMCLTKDGVQWTGMHWQQEKLMQLGIAAGWATMPMPKQVWHLLPGQMPYVLVHSARVDTSDLRTTLGSVIDQLTEQEEVAQKAGDHAVTVHTDPCMICGKGGTVTMPAQAYERWRAGEHIQKAWPEGSDGEREQLATGTHGECFDKAFPEEDD